MNRNLLSTGSALDRYLPLALGALILLIGYARFVQPNVSEYFRLRGEVQVADARVKGLQETAARERTQGPVDEGPGLKEFERLVPEQDNVVEVVEKLIRSALDGVPKDRVRNLSIQTGERSDRVDAASTRSGASGDSSDPRLGLFNARLSQTPVTIAFESYFDVIGEFIWRLRDTPTIVEVRSATLTRGLPLMKVELTVLIYQRTGPAGGGSTSGAGSSDSPQSGLPRIAMLLDSERR